MPNSHTTHRDRGSVFMMVLMAVVLFAALSFTFSRGIQQGGESISNRQAALLATDIITYSQKVERAVQSTLSKGISESDISFINDTVTGYENPDCPAGERCEIFKSSGGKLVWQTPPGDANNGEPYFIGSNQIGLAAEGVDATRRDLVLLLPVKPAICKQVNEMTSRAETWVSARTPNDGTKFIGSYITAPGTGITWSTAPNSRPTGCFCTGVAPCDGGDPHYFYHLLHARG